MLNIKNEIKSFLLPFLLIANAVPEFLANTLKKVFMKIKISGFKGIVYFWVLRRYC